MGKITSNQFRGYIKPGAAADGLLKPMFTPGNLYLIEITRYFDSYGAFIGAEATIVDELTGVSKFIDLPIAYINDLFIEATGPAAQVLFGQPKK